MNIDSRKISLAKQVLNINDEEVIKAVENLMKELNIAEYESNLKPKSLKQYKEEIQYAIEDEKAGRLTKATDLKNQIKGWI